MEFDDDDDDYYYLILPFRYSVHRVHCFHF